MQNVSVGRRSQLTHSLTVCIIWCTACLYVSMAYYPIYTVLNTIITTNTIYVLYCVHCAFRFTCLTHSLTHSLSRPPLNDIVLLYYSQYFGTMYWYSVLTSIGLMDVLQWKKRQSDINAAIGDIPCFIERRNYCDGCERVFAFRFRFADLQILGFSG